MVARGDYGPVLIVRGDHKGTVGYYDDDEGGRAVVYLGEPFVSDPVLLPRGTLQKIAMPRAPSWRSGSGDTLGSRSSSGCREGSRVRGHAGETGDRRETAR